jgi:hypothetical protein
MRRPCGWRLVYAGTDSGDEAARIAAPLFKSTGFSPVYPAAATLGAAALDRLRWSIETIPVEVPYSKQELGGVR